jgi:hypothetical protein
LGAERPDTEAGGHIGRFCCELGGVDRACCCERRGSMGLWN